MGIKVTMDTGATYTAQQTDTLRPWNAVPVDVYTVQDSNGATVGTVHREVQGDGTALWTYDGGAADTLWRAVRAMVGGAVTNVETTDDTAAPVENATPAGHTRFIVTDYPRGRMMPARERVVVAATFTHALSVAAHAGGDVVYDAPRSGVVSAANRGAYQAFAYAVVETHGERARRGMPADGPADVVLPALTARDAR